MQKTLTRRIAGGREDEASGRFFHTHGEEKSLLGNFKI